MKCGIVLFDQNFRPFKTARKTTFPEERKKAGEPLYESEEAEEAKTEEEKKLPEGSPLSGMTYGSVTELWMKFPKSYFRK